MGIGIWAVADKIYISDVIGNSLFKSAAILMVICGVFIILQSFVGCLGAIAKNKPLVMAVCRFKLTFLPGFSVYTILFE